MGDGSISKYQVSISLNHITDAEYLLYVCDLIRYLFKIEPHVQHRPKLSMNVIVISRIELVAYLQEMGLPQGNKIDAQIDIADWIKENPEYLTACVRGLVDTDGCIFNHSYISKDKRYTYKKLDFTSASELLRTSVYTFFEELGMHPRFSSQRGVRLESRADIALYFKVVSTHNPKHLNRYAS